MSIQPQAQPQPHPELGALGLSNTAHERYCRFYPRARYEDVLFALSLAKEVDPSIAMSLVGRPHQAYNSRYLLHPEHTGLFVICGGTVVTFLRFCSLSQHKNANNLFGPPPSPVSACVLWNREDEASGTLSSEEEEVRALGESVHAVHFDDLEVPGQVRERLGLSRVHAHGVVFTALQQGAKRLSELPQFKQNRGNAFVVWVGDVPIGACVKLEEGNRLVAHAFLPKEIKKDRGVS